MIMKSLKIVLVNYLLRKNKMNSEIEKEAKKMADNFRQEIKESKHGLLKLLGIELLPILMGASLGGIGRVTGEHWIPALPIGIDLMVNATGYTSTRGLWGLVKYGAGVSLPYADKIYQAVIPLIDKF